MFICRSALSDVYVADNIVKECVVGYNIYNARYFAAIYAVFPKRCRDHNSIFNPESALNHKIGAVFISGRGYLEKLFSRAVNAA